MFDILVVAYCSWEATLWLDCSWKSGFRRCRGSGRSRDWAFYLGQTFTGKFDFQACFFLFQLLLHLSNFILAENVLHYASRIAIFTVEASQIVRKVWQRKNSGLIWYHSCVFN